MSSVFFSDIRSTPEEYQTRFPFPYLVQDHILNDSIAEDLQREILSLDDSMWDRYDNPFEEKYTLRDKYAFPPLLRSLFEYLESDEFISTLSTVCGVKLIKDPTRNFWGVHKYKTGDKLDIHVDAGLHPATKQKKQVTLGIYLSKEWKEEYGCHLEIWKGDNASQNDAKLHEKVASIEPRFNRLVVFTCDDYSWHGNPISASCPDNAKRIFITISYLSEEADKYQNKRVKAFFVARPDDPVNEEKDKLRLLRADPEKYAAIYRTK